MITDLISHVEHNDLAEIIEYHDKEKGWSQYLMDLRKRKLWGLDGDSARGQGNV